MRGGCSGETFFVIGFCFGGSFGGLGKTDGDGASFAPYLLINWFGVFSFLAKFDEVFFENQSSLLGWMIE